MDFDRAKSPNVRGFHACKSPTFLQQCDVGGLDPEKADSAWVANNLPDLPVSLRGTAQVVLHNPSDDHAGRTMHRAFGSHEQRVNTSSDHVKDH